jgi:hypothetical protein
LIFDEKKVGSLEEGFGHRLLQAQELLLEDFSHSSFFSRIRDGLFRLVAPLL